MSYSRAIRGRERVGLMTSAAAGPAPSTAAKARAGFLVWLFFLATISPVFIDLGTVALPPYRLMLAIAVIPCMVLWVQGKLGRIRAADLMIVAFTIWVAVCIVVNHGLMNEYEFIGFTFIDTAGAYFLGRTLIRNAAAFLGMVKVHLATLVFLLPFAILETQTGDPLLIELLQPYIRTQPVIDHEIRLGLERAQTVFQHPILFGVYSVGIFGLVFFGLGYGASKLRTIWRFTVVTVCTICSVSSGAFLALLIQLVFLIYEYVTAPRSWRWKVILLLLAIFYIIMDVVANRPPLQIFISYLTLNPSTGFNRLRIWEYGVQNVAANPIFGLGLRDWVRARWMVASADNFWLVVAMRYGYPGIILYLGAFMLLVWQLSVARHLSPLTAAIRSGVLISLGGVMIAAITVSLWGPIYSWLMFFLGAIIWILDEEDARRKNSDAAPLDANRDTEETSGPRGGQITYSRFAHKKRP